MVTNEGLKPTEMHSLTVPGEALIQYTEPKQAVSKTEFSPGDEGNQSPISSSF